MVKIELDEAYAYDLLSIAAVKLAKRPTSINLFNYHRLERQLVEQVGSACHDAILHSPQYASLYHTNLALFNHIDDMKAREPQLDDGRLVDLHNYNRFCHKRAIQEQFFPESPLSEQKIGYTEEAV